METPLGIIRKIDAMMTPFKGPCYVGWIAAFLIVWIGGCGRSSGLPRYDVSGAVTFGGQPVPSGMISFDPAEQSIGGGFAPIVDGKFDTGRGGRGHLGGEHVVHISGHASEPPAPDSPGADRYVVQELFAPYVAAVDLPKKKAVMDFDVPSR